MKKNITAFLLVFVSAISCAQNIGINSTGSNPAPSAMLDVDAAPGNNKGMLIPRISLTAINSATPIASPATSLLVYNTASAGSGTTAVTPGYYYWDGSKWVRMQTSASTAQDWNLLGNGGTSPGTHFIGTTDNQDLVIKTNNAEKLRATSAGNIGIGTSSPNSSALLDLSSTNKGFLLPRISLASNTDITTIPSPSTGLQVYNTNYTSTLSTGICYFDGTKWLNLSTYLPSGYSYFTQLSAFSVQNNGATSIIPFGTITAPQSGIFNANLRMFTTSQVGPTTSPITPNETAFYFNVYVNGVIQEAVEYYTYNSGHIATSVTLRYMANAGDVITFGYVVLAGYSLDFSSPLFFGRNNVVISKIQ